MYKCDGTFVVLSVPLRITTNDQLKKLWKNLIFKMFTVQIWCQTVQPNDDRFARTPLQ